MIVADGAPSGAGLAIIGVVLLVFLAAALAVIVLLARLIRRGRNRRHPTAPDQD